MLRTEYELVVRDDLVEFNEHVSAMLSDGWELYGDPVLPFAAQVGGPHDKRSYVPEHSRYGQALIRRVRQ